MINMIFNEAKMTSDCNVNINGEMGKIQPKQVLCSEHTSPYNLTSQKLRTTMKTRKTEIHTAGLMDLFQNWITVAAALSSAGTEIVIAYPDGELNISLPPQRPSWLYQRGSQKFQPAAAPNAGSTYFVAWRTNPPVDGMKEVISPVVKETPAVTRPMRM